MSKRSSGTRKRIRRGLWSPEEDVKLMNHVSKYGHGCWSYVPKLAGIERGGKSCRLRWLNYLRPGLKRGAFSVEEEDLIVRLHSILGNRWSQIAARLAGRTDNEVKNFWHSFIKKKLHLRGIDPVTHKPVAEGSSTCAAVAKTTATRTTAASGESGLILSSAGQYDVAHVPPQSTAKSYMYIRSSTSADGGTSTSAHASVDVRGCCSDASMAPAGYCLELDTDALHSVSSDIVHPVVPSSSCTVCSIAGPGSAGTAAASTTVEQYNDDHELWLEPEWTGTCMDASIDHYGTGTTLDDLKWSDCIFDARYQLHS